MIFFVAMALYYITLQYKQYDKIVCLYGLTLCWEKKKKKYPGNQMCKKNIISIRHGRKEEPGPDVLIMFLFVFFLNIKMQSIRSTM